MGPAKSDTIESLVMEFEEEELSPAQLEHKVQIEKKINILNKHIQGLHQDLESQPPIEYLCEPAAQPPQQSSNISQNVQPKNPGQQSKIVVVDSTPVMVTIPKPPGVGNAVRQQLQTPSTSGYRTVVPTIRPRGGTAFRGKRPGIMRGSATPRPPWSTSPIETPPKQTLEKNKNYIVDLTDEDYSSEVNDSLSRADTKEVNISTLSEKTFPSLVVIARPNMSPKAFTNQQLSLERASLDEKVKQVLTLSTSKYIEWLLQHGLLRSEQECNSNIKSKTHQRLKLGMYSDTSKFPYSGGYVWISECCPSHFLSVFSGSLFEATPHSPSVVLKLVYHWACQTAVQNVIQWVKVDNLFVKTLYTNLRAICTAAIYQRFPIFGGPNKRVQIGVISLGTTAQDGTSRQVKVEILGIYDESTQMLRVRAIEPIVAEKNEDQASIMKRRFRKALEPLLRCVNLTSEIMIDCTVDKNTLVSYGFSKVCQVVGDHSKSGYKIMDYLKVVIPRMFQNTLSLLSRQIIQQFLDELVWREAYGPIPSRAFESIIEHTSEQTRLNTGGTLVNRLSRISLNPFRNWEYNRWMHNCKAGPNLPVKNEEITPVRVSISTIKEIEKMSQQIISSFNPSNEKNRITTPLSSVKPIITHPNMTTVPKKKNSLMVPEIIVEPGSYILQESSKRMIAQKHEPAMIALEPYYYGILEGDSSKHKYVPFYTQCYICRTDFKNVIKLADHLILHALNKDLESVNEPKDICKLCLKIRLPGSKQHHTQMCQPGMTGLSCKICSIKMKDNGSLIYHMTKTHNQLDMPYLCGKCNYRVSELHELNSHYAKAHSNGTTGMCPFCLKLVDFATPAGDDLEHNQLFFIKHIQRHVLPSSKKCSRCLLNFINKPILCRHETKMHSSCADNEDVLRYIVDEPTLMPAPIADPALAHKLMVSDLKPASQLKGISTVSLRIVPFLPSDNTLCQECESPVDPQHFSSFLMCNKCSYRTCCPLAISEHVSQKHPPYPLSSPVYIGMKVDVNGKLFCSSCSYSTRNGNAMGTHMVTCGNGTCVIGRKRPIMKVEEMECLPSTSGRKRSRRSKAGNGNSDSTLNQGIIKVEDEVSQNTEEAQRESQSVEVLISEEDKENENTNSNANEILEIDD